MEDFQEGIIEDEMNELENEERSRACNSIEEGEYPTAGI